MLAMATAIAFVLDRMVQPKEPPVAVLVLGPGSDDVWVRPNWETWGGAVSWDRMKAIMVAGRVMESPDDHQLVEGAVKAFCDDLTVAESGIVDIVRLERLSDPAFSQRLADSSLLHSIVPEENCLN